MRKLMVMEFITLDGIIQGPGAPEEDTENGFTFGGWVAPYGDEVFNTAIQKYLQPADLLLGRKTFDIWENYWPQHANNWPGINEVTKYVLSNTRVKSDWSNTVFLKDVADIEALKKSEGTDIKLWGSSEVVRLLLKHSLVDELCLMLHPVVLGKGKRLFGDGSVPSAFTLTESVTTSTGVIIATYKHSGQVQTGTVGT